MNEIIHRKRLFDGRPAEEVYAETAWPGAKCHGCGGGPPVMRAQVFVALADMSSATRTAMMYEIAFKRVLTKKTPRGIAVKYSEAHACRHCKATLERTLARAPSYAMIDVDRGPGPERIIVGVAANIS